MSRILVFDGDCGFCTSAARWIAARSDVVTEPWQRADLDARGLRLEQVQAAVWFVDGHARLGGADAIAAALRRARRRGWRMLGFALAWPFVRPLAALGYRLVARYRHLLPGGTPECAMPPAVNPSVARSAPN